MEEFKRQELDDIHISGLYVDEHSSTVVVGIC